MPSEYAITVSGNNVTLPWNTRPIVEEPDSKLYRTVIVVEVLSSDLFDMEDLETVAYQITDGECSGSVAVVQQAEVSRDTMRSLLEDQGSDPTFLVPDDEEDDNDEDD